MSLQIQKVPLQVFFWVSLKGVVLNDSNMHLAMMEEFKEEENEWRLRYSWKIT
jgi:hypothetical protein